jgi:hypothetical protein
MARQTALYSFPLEYAKLRTCDGLLGCHVPKSLFGRSGSPVVRVVTVDLPTSADVWSRRMERDDVAQSKTANLWLGPPTRPRKRPGSALSWSVYP